MKKQFFLFAAISAYSVIYCYQAASQNNVGIGTTTPANTAILDLTATDKGLLVPRLTTAQRTAIASPSNGLLVYDTTTLSFWYFDGTQWVQVGAGSGGGTLDNAYDFGGPGLGRTIYADANPVEIIGTGTVTPNQGRLHVTTVGGSIPTPSVAITGEINTATSVGFGIAGTVANSDNPGAGVYAESNGTGQALSATMTGTGSAGYFEVTNAASTFSAVQGITNGSGDAVLGLNTSATGRAASFSVSNPASTADALFATSNGSSVSVIRSQNTTTGVALNASSTNTANTFSTVQATTVSGTANAAGVVGSSTGNASGVAGQVAIATATAQQGVLGINARTNGGHGVRGTGYNGVVGETQYSSGYAVYGDNADAIAPLGNGIGVLGIGFVGVYGQDRYGGIGYGVYSDGELGASGTKSFVIDHPLDPENKFLKHFTLESPEVLNVYRGSVQCDQNGEATVQLPAYFSSININFSYQLTPVGDYAPLFIKRKIENNSFTIGGGKPEMEVSWMVIGERNDLYVRKYPHAKNPESEKRAHEKGKYQTPSLYGQPEEKKILRKPDLQHKQPKEELVNVLGGEAKPVAVQKKPVN
ncbi:MAG: hypothetical protein HYY40_12195 [Bacteroidetes bacterium]|nr:hypothetical protein [Bacteroidota bacterium]